MNKAKYFQVNHKEGNYNASHIKTFEFLYDRYAAKAMGFITPLVDTKEQAEDILTKVFIKVWADLKEFEENAEKKILAVILIICRPIIKNRITV